MLTLSRLIPFLLLAGLLQAKPVLVATTTLIATAVRDVSGEAFEIEILMPAGTCPGQFDLDPRQAGIVSRASLVLRHEMQGFLDRLFLAAGARREAIAAPHGAFTIPGAYLAYCEKIAEELARAEPSLAPLIASRCAALKGRLLTLSTELREAALGLAGTRAVCAQFQADLISWLGLEVVAIFPPSEDPSPATLRRAVEAGRDKAAALVVGNVQNGARVPETVAKALGVSCVMLSNFPLVAAAGAQDELMRANLKELLAWHREKRKS